MHQPDFSRTSTHQHPFACSPECQRVCGFITFTTKMGIGTGCTWLKMNSSVHSERRNLTFTVCVCVTTEYGLGMFDSLQQSQTSMVFNTHGIVLPWWLGLTVALDSWGCMFMCVCLCARRELLLENIPVACGFCWAADLFQLHLWLFVQLFISF